jgi:hypothetical protein
MFLLALGVSLLVFRKLLPYTFTQDDFYLLRQAQVTTLKKFIKHSSPRQESIYFRPLGMQGYFWLNWRLLGFRPEAWRYVNLVVHSLNGALVYLLTKRVIGKYELVTMLLYLTAPLHFAAIGWIANVSFLTGTTITLLTILTALDKRKSTLMLIGLYTTALLINELTIVIPLLLLLLSVWKLDSLPQERLLHLFAVLVPITGLYLIFRARSPITTVSEYEMGIGRHVAQNIRWLLLWTFGWAESTKDYFVSLFRLKKEFTTSFPVETTVQVTGTAVLIMISLIGLWRKRRLLLGLAWFLISIMPVILFRRHLFPHYAMIGSIGFFWIVVGGWSCLRRPLRYLFIGLWTLQVSVIMQLNLITHWWIHHTQLTDKLLDDITMRYPSLPPSKEIIVQTDDPDRARIVLAGDNAVQLLYNDPQAKVVFNKP